MRFTVTGKLNGRSRTLQWRDGKTQGEPEYEAAVAAAVDAGANVALAGLVSGTATLEDPYLALATMLVVLDDGGADATYAGNALPARKLPTSTEGEVVA